MIRLVAQMSEEEMQALYIVQSEEHNFFHGDRGQRQSPAVEVATIASTLGWEPINALVACQGLEQLNLIQNGYPSNGFYTGGDSLPGDRVFRTTELGHRLVVFAHGGSWPY